MIKNRDSILKQLFSKRNRLLKQLEAAEPIIPYGSVVEGHIRKMANAEEFLKELDEVETCFITDKQVVLASSLAEYRKIISEACLKKISFKGKWCRLCMVCEKELGRVYWLLYVSPVEKI